jgi:outer membrane PBP1 activator LpoA protein
MRKMKHVVLYCTAILLSVAGFGVCAEEALGTKAVDKPLVILFAPSENTPAFSLTQPFRDGILAAYEEDKDQYELRQMPLDPGSNVEEALAAAADAGAMLVIGPIFKNSVNEVATMSYVPVPVLAINRTQQQEVPKLFMSIDMSSEGQMEQLVREAVTKTADGAAGQPFVIFTTEQAYDQGLSRVAQEELLKQGVAADVVLIAPENFGALRKRFESARPRGAIFATDSAHASLVRPYLPSDVATFGTSYTNPQTQSDPMTALTQSNDLKGMVTLELPSIIEMDAPTYSKYRDRLMQLKGDDRLMFSIGVDSWRLGKDWLQWHEKMDYADGLSGKLHFDKNASPRVQRELVPAVVTTKAQTHAQDELEFEEDEHGNRTELQGKKK